MGSSGLFFLDDDSEQSQCMPTLIEPGLYLGSIASEQASQLLRGLGITHVLSLTTGFAPLAPRSFQYLVISMLDHAGVSLFPHMEACLSHITEGVNAGGVLVHCQAGISRSAAIVIAYLIAKNKWNYETAFTFVKARRPIIDPNYGFVEQLKVWADMGGILKWEHTTYMSWAARFDDRGQARSMAVFIITPSEAGGDAFIALERLARGVLDHQVSWGEARTKPLAYGIVQLEIACVFKKQDLSADDIMSALVIAVGEMAQAVDLSMLNSL